MGNFHRPSKCPYQYNETSPSLIAECWVPCCSPASTFAEACCNLKEDWTVVIIFFIIFGMIVFSALFILCVKIFCPEEIDKRKLKVQKIFCKEKYEKAMLAKKRREQRKNAENSASNQMPSSKRAECKDNFLKRDSNLIA